MFIQCPENLPFCRTREQIFIRALKLYVLALARLARHCKMCGLQLRTITSASRWPELNFRPLRRGALVKVAATKSKKHRLSLSPNQAEGCCWCARRETTTLTSPARAARKKSINPLSNDDAGRGNQPVPLHRAMALFFLQRL